jgi:hypothetical protein
MGTAIFPTGTTSVFRQTAAPTGWTKNTVTNDFTLRVVSGTATSGGSLDFTAVMTNRTITGTLSKSGSPAYPINVESQTVNPSLPSHTHGANARGFLSGTSVTAVPFTSPGPTTRFVWGSATSMGNSGPAGGGTGHSHTITVNSATLVGTTKNFSVNYVDVIVASIN